MDAAGQLQTSSSEWYCYFFDARLHPVTVSLSLRLFVELYLYRPQFFNSFKNIGGSVPLNDENIAYFVLLCILFCACFGVSLSSDTGKAFWVILL